jgi:VanZ family protein
MLHYVKKYPISLAVLCIIICLSFFEPPTIDTTHEFLYWDKIVHICMYGGLSGMLWLEFLRIHRGRSLPLPRVLIVAVICPIAFSGIVELLQEYCTKYRSGDWLDFTANTAGVILGSLVSYYGIRRFFMK